MRHPFLRHWLLCGLLLLVTACDLGKTEPRPLRLTTVKWVGFIPFYVARDLQLYPPPGLDISMTPGEAFAFTNAYLGRLSPIIRRCGGFIDKYIGDPIMALFPGKADDAVCAAGAARCPRGTEPPAGRAAPRPHPPRRGATGARGAIKGPDPEENP